MKYFKPKEFSEDIKYADSKLLKNLDRLREYLGTPVYPSPVPGALARFDLGAKRSQHYAVKRLSTAIDFFVKGDPFEVYIKILKSGLFPRIGVYFDTFYKNRKHVMFHCDLKDQNLLWLRDKHGYTYSTQSDFYIQLRDRWCLL